MERLSSPPHFENGALRIAVLIAAFIAISIGRLIIGPQGLGHELLLRLYYLPIIASGYWYGASAGVIVAFVCAVAYVFHVSTHLFTADPGRLAEVMVFHVVGLSVGFLSTAQRRVTVRYRQAAVTLETANRQLRESYEQLQRIDRLKTLGEVASGLAHEVRNPLASIRGALEIIDGRSRAGSPEAEFCRVAMTEVDRLDRLIREFLRYARPHDPELRCVPLHDVIERVVMLLRVQAERAGVALEVERAEEILEVSIDPLQIEQALLNVVLKAIQATAPGSAVRIRERIDQPYASIEVIDEGPGIADADVSRIFNPFFTTKEQGTGLGLGIAQRIVSAHDGVIQVHRTLPRGTCFQIRLPMSDRHSTRVGAPTAEVAI